MYTLFNNTNPVWSLSPGPARQVYYEATPTTPLLMNAPPNVNQSTTQSFYYRTEPAYYAPVRSSVPSRPRLPSDDVFLPDGMFVYDAPVYNCLITTPQAQLYQLSNSGVALSMKEITHQGDYPSKQPSLSCQLSSISGSPESRRNNSGESKKLSLSLDSLSMSSNSNSSSPTSNKHDDSIIHSLFSTSLRVALNEDPPEPAAVAKPLKTSSPIREESEGKPLLIDITNMRKRRGRFITSSSSEKCPRFSENGICDDLDQCDKILMRSREHNAADDAAKKRGEFLLILEAERERQKKLVLPKHAPKMSCKFCRNNGESAEVYTKHRLHYNEKTVCPLLRHYICRLCNSTGDFAHTIRHCPFNDKKDRIAWKATFLV